MKHIIHEDKKTLTFLSACSCSKAQPRPYNHVLDHGLQLPLEDNLETRHQVFNKWMVKDTSKDARKSSCDRGSGSAEIQERPAEQSDIELLCIAFIGNNFVEKQIISSSFELKNGQHEVMNLTLLEEITITNTIYYMGTHLYNG